MMGETGIIKPLNNMKQWSAKDIKVLKETIANSSNREDGFKEASRLLGRTIDSCKWKFGNYTKKKRKYTKSLNTTPSVKTTTDAITFTINGFTITVSNNQLIATKDDVSVTLKQYNK